MGSIRWAMFPVLMLVATLAHGDISLSAVAAVDKPDQNAYPGALQMNGTWYAEVPFQTVSSCVAAEGGQPDSWASISWEIMIGYDEGNQGVAYTCGDLVRFDRNGKWAAQPQLSGSAWVSVGSRHARAVADIYVSGGSSAHAEAVRAFSVIAPQAGGPPGGGGGDG